MIARKVNRTLRGRQRLKTSGHTCGAAVDKRMTTPFNDAYSFTLVATPTPIQAQAFSLLAIDPAKLSPVTDGGQRLFSSAVSMIYV